jgi:hypothetical protein
MEFKGLRDLIRDSVQSNKRYNDSIPSDEKASKCGEIRDSSSSEGMGCKEKESELVALEKDRGKIYGDPFLSHQAIGLVWEGIFRNRYHDLSRICQVGTIGTDNFPIPKPGSMFPADLVAEMLAGFKITRLARPVYHKDSGDDAKVYIDFSQRFRSEK